MKRITIQLLAAFLLSAGALFAQTPVEFKAVDPIGRNTVQFKTTAPLEDIVGVTNKISGAVHLDPKDIRKAPAHARLEVDLASLSTGIGLRDTHMREQYLHTDKYPRAIFTLEKIAKSSAPALSPNATVQLTIEGTFDLHGVKRKIQVPVQATYLPESPSTMGKLPGNLLRIASRFDVKLADYNIERPQMVLLKVGEVARVDIDVFATDADPQKLSAWMEQMKKMMGDD